MNLYISHSSSFDFASELYLPIKKSSSDKQHNIVLPHEKTSELFDSKEYFAICNLVIAEISYPSTGMGIELGWAELMKVPIVGLYKKDTQPSKSALSICKKLYTYETPKEISNIIDTIVSEYE